MIESDSRWVPNAVDATASPASGMSRTGRNVSADQTCKYPSRWIAHHLAVEHDSRSHFRALDWLLDAFAVQQDPANIVSAADNIARGRQQDPAYRLSMPVVFGCRVQRGRIPDSQPVAKATTDESPPIRRAGERRGTEFVDSRQHPGGRIDLHQFGDSEQNTN